MTTLTDIPRKTTRGTAFLIEESTPQDVFTPEDLSEEQLAEMVTRDGMVGVAKV